MWIGKPAIPSVIPPLLLAYVIASVGVDRHRLQQRDDADAGAAETRSGVVGTAATGYIGGILSLILCSASWPFIRTRAHAVWLGAAVRAGSVAPSGRRITGPSPASGSSFSCCRCLFYAGLSGKLPVLQRCAHACWPKQTLCELPKHIYRVLPARRHHLHRRAGVAVRVRRHLRRRHVRLAHPPDRHPRNPPCHRRHFRRLARRQARRHARAERSSWAAF